MEARRRVEEKQEIIKVAFFINVLATGQIKMCAVHMSYEYRNVDVVPKSSPPAFDPEYGGIVLTSLQTLAGNSAPHCLLLLVLEAIKP